jgi:hypothetical protein
VLEGDHNGNKDEKPVDFHGEDYYSAARKRAGLLGYGSTGVSGTHVPLRYSAHSTSPISALWPAFGILQPFELFEPLERFELILLLPAAAERAIELHHGIQLPAPHPGQGQLLVEELLVGDQDL